MAVKTDAQPLVQFGGRGSDLRVCCSTAASRRHEIPGRSGGTPETRQGARARPRRAPNQRGIRPRAQTQAVALRRRGVCTSEEKTEDVPSPPPPAFASPFSGRGCSASPCSKAPPPSRHARTHKRAQINTRARGRLTRNDARGRGAAERDGLCRSGFGVLRSRRQKVTLRPVPDSASTPSRCAQRGGAPRHRRASGGMAQRLPLNGGQNQAAKQRESARGGSRAHASVVVVVWWARR